MRNNLKQSCNLISLAFLIFLASCQPKTVPNVSQPEEIMQLSEPSFDIDKDAVRLKGEVVKVIEKVEGSGNNSYEFSISEVMKKGSTFSGNGPDSGQSIQVITDSSVSFSVGEKLTVDVTPLNAKKNKLKRAVLIKYTKN